MTFGRAESASEIVAAIDRSLPPEPRLRDLMTALGSHASGIFLALIAIPALIPAPGIPFGAVFGTVLTIIACRMAWSGDQHKLPDWLASRPLPPALIRLLTSRGPALLRVVEHRLKPRAGLLVGNVARPPLALVIALMGILIALPIPFGNTLPGFSVILMGLGLTARDGMAVMSALVLALLALGSSLALGWATLWSIAHLLML